MTYRSIAALASASMSLMLALIAIGNLTDYDTNFHFVAHVMSMDTIFPGSGIGYRAITAEWAHHAAYAVIIAVQVIACLLTGGGALAMWGRRHLSAPVYVRASRLASMGLMLGAGLYLVGFIIIGGEWFGMWMSSTWNGVASAFRFFACLSGALAFVAASARDRDWTDRGG